SIPTRGWRSRYFSRFKALVAAFRSRCAWSTSTAGSFASTFSIHESGTFARHKSTCLRIVREPCADFAGFGMVGLQLQHPRVVLTGQSGLVQLLGAQVGQREVCAELARVGREQFFELVRCVVGVAAVSESECEVVAGVGGIGFERERRLVRDQRQPKVAVVLCRQAQVIASVEVSGIGAKGILILFNRLGWLAGL